jgi:RNA polymerase sigma factor (TIGR02999 family)
LNFIAMTSGMGSGSAVQGKGGVLVAAISELADLWLGFARGDAASRDVLLGLYYEEFRKIARRMLTTDSSRARLQPTDLVHEAVLRIIAGNGVAVRDQNHLLSLAARVMRVTLLDEVRKYKAAKRGDVVTLWPDAEEAMPPLEIEAFDETLERLAKIEPDGARIIELRFYAGMTLPEISAALELSESTVQRRWRTARAWIIKELQITD